MVTDKQFRSDLYYRLNVFPILNPPLRERPDDIPALVQYFTQKFATRMNRHITTIPTETMTALSRYHWPGNIRELENFIERAVILTRGSSLTVPLSGAESRGASTVGWRRADTCRRSKTPSASTSVRRCSRPTGSSAVPAGAAAKLGMKRTTLQSKMAKLGIERPAAR